MKTNSSKKDSIMNKSISSAVGGEMVPNLNLPNMRCSSSKVGASLDSPKTGGAVCFGKVSSTDSPTAAIIRNNGGNHQIKIKNRNAVAEDDLRNYNENNVMF